MLIALFLSQQAWWVYASSELCLPRASFAETLTLLCYGKTANTPTLFYYGKKTIPLCNHEK